jgi:hypothetical protein
MSTRHLTWLCAAPSALLLALAASTPALANPPTVDINWTDLTAPVDVHFNNLSPVDVPHVVNLTYSIANASSATLTIEAPPNVAIVQVSTVSGGSGSVAGTWTSNIVRVAGSVTWDSSATVLLTSAQGASNLTGTFAVAYRTRNGAFLNGESVNFEAVLSATSATSQTASDDDTVNLTLQSTAALSFQGAISRTATGTFQGQTGTFRIWEYEALRETGNGRIDSGTIQLVIPSPAKFISLDTSPNYPYTTHVPWTVTQSLAQGASGTMVMTFNGPMGRNGGLLSPSSAVPTMPSKGPLMDTRSFRIVYFVPCDAPSVSVSLSAQGTQLGIDSTQNRTVSAPIRLNASGGTGNCAGSTGKVTFNTSEMVAPGSNASFQVSAQAGVPVSGSFSFPTSVVVVDRLPHGVTDFTSITVDPNSSPSFTMHLCWAPSFPGTFDYSDFDVLRNASSGERCVPYTLPLPSLPGEPTHLVAYASEWRDEIAPGIFGMAGMIVTVKTTVQLNAQTGSYLNRMCMHGVAPQPPASFDWLIPNPDRYSTCPATGDLRPNDGCKASCFSVVNTAIPLAFIHVTNATTPSSPNLFNRNEVAKFYVSIKKATGSAPLNFDPAIPDNKIRISLPPGFEVIPNTATQQMACSPDVVLNGPEFTPTVVPGLQAGVTDVIWTPTTNLVVDNCFDNVPSAINNWSFIVQARASMTFPFINLQNYPASVEYNVANSTNSPSATLGVSVLAPSQLELDVSATSCTATGFGVTSTFENQGGQTLTNVTLDVPIPAGSTWASNGVPVFTDMTNQQSLSVFHTISTTATGILLEVPNLPPYSRTDFEVNFASGSGQTAYTVAAEISSGALGTEASREFSTAGCPSAIQINKTLSSVINGSPALPLPMEGVSFRLEGPFGYNQIHITDVDGLISIEDLAPGSWTVTEITPTTANGAAFAAPFSGQWFSTVTLVSQETGVIDVTNVCSCPDAPCVNEGSCSWDVDTLTASCNSTPVTCAAGTCGAFCDTSLDMCVEVEPTPCNNPGGHVIWGSATVSGAIKYFRCTVSGTNAPPVCDTDPVTGYLVLTDPVGGQCQP